MSAQGYTNIAGRKYTHICWITVFGGWNTPAKYRAETMCGSVKPRTLTDEQVQLRETLPNALKLARSLGALCPACVNRAERIIRERRQF